MTHRILYLGNDWYGSCARACGYALRRAGHEVIDVSTDGWDPKGARKITKAILRLARPLLHNEFNDAILDAARRFTPDLVIAFKGNMVARSTLQALRRAGIALYQYFPDNSVFSQQLVDPKSMEEYDCCFFTKKFLVEDASKVLKLRDSIYLPHGYDSELHRIPALDSADRELYGGEVTAIVVHTAAKEKFLDQLLRLRPDLPLVIWGSGWTERCRSQRVKACAVGIPIFGQAYVKALHASKINLALLTEQNRGSSGADQTTTRSFEIPACGGFMLHPRTSDIHEFYKEGLESELFDSPQEALEKIEYYLAHPVERAAIATSGWKRAVPSYSYDERMRTIIAYHDTKRAGTAYRELVRQEQRQC